MTKTIKDLDVSKFESKIPSDKHPNRILRFWKNHEDKLYAAIDGFSNTPFFRGDKGWVTVNFPTGIYVDWISYALSVLNEFEEWAKLELEKLNALPDIPLPDGCEWFIDDDGFVCIDDSKDEVVYTYSSLHSPRELDITVAELNLRAQKLGFNVQLTMSKV